ncbi:MAG: tetratricopeptide repeat protein [Bacteroidales bacterium]|nr:tetratricopeptide repeat protein [Bacteroidales bacterium]
MSNKGLHKDIENWAVLLGGGMSLLVICNIVLLVVVCLLISGCGTSRKVERMQERQMRAEIGMVEEMPDRAGNDGEKISPRTSFGRNDNKGMPGQAGHDGRGDNAVRDTTLVTSDEGPIIMNAVRDEDGNMVATDVLEAASVTARFRNVAERGGKVNIEFAVTVPQDMMDPQWQLRFYPRMYVLEDTLGLDPVLITGQEYRNEQMRGYRRYEKFLRSIVTDSMEFVNMRLLEIFIERNIPALYAFRTDSTFVSDAEFASAFGVTEQQAIEHYTNRLAKSANERRKARKEERFRQYVKVPIEQGFRLDTVMREINGDFRYVYSHTLASRPRLRKVDVVLSGEIYQEDVKIYDIPECEPLTYYISSLSAFVDGTERYMTKVIERKVSANTACYVEFEHDRYEVDESLGYNRDEIGRIKDNLAALIDHDEFEMDSIVVTASSSPEGTVAYNTRLTQRRSEAVAEYFRRFIDEYRDSVKADEGFAVDMTGDPRSEPGMTGEGIRFIARNDAENWRMLDVLVAEDTVMSYEDKIAYINACELDDLDEREEVLQNLGCYRHLREKVYPRLRTVKFDFYLHRKDMQKDTVHTTVIDSTYMAGVQAIRDRDYETAVTLLRPYQDYNAAVAFCALDYNASALAILERLHRTDQVNYMLAIVYSRLGEIEKAVRCYEEACRQNPGFVHRGNLDPEISRLSVFR